MSAKLNSLINIIIWLCRVLKVITSPSGRIYIGQSKNIENRLKKYKSLSVNKQPKIERSIKNMVGIITHSKL